MYQAVSGFTTVRPSRYTIQTCTLTVGVRTTHLARFHTLFRISGWLEKELPQQIRHFEGDYNRRTRLPSRTHTLPTHTKHRTKQRQVINAISTRTRTDSRRSRRCLSSDSCRRLFNRSEIYTAADSCSYDKNRQRISVKTSLASFHGLLLRDQATTGVTRLTDWSQHEVRHERCFYFYE